MKLPQIRRVSREDLKDAPDWVDNLLTPLNSFMETVYQGLNKQITFQDNIRGATRELQFTTLSTYTSGDFTPITFSYGGGALRPEGVLLLQIQAANGAVIKQSVTIQWSELNGAISIDYVSGLANGTSYFIKLLVI